MLVEASSPADVLARVCAALLAGAPDRAREIARAEYPFVRHENAGRKYTELQSMRIFLRDRFTDRYSGARLVFPGTLRLLSKLMPEELPFHSSWKMTDCHLSYWQLFPTVDHVLPVARGGADDESNWVTTSMLRNSAKSNWTLDDLGWSLRPVDSDDAWDGLLGFCRDLVTGHPEHLADKYIARWHRAATIALTTAA